MEPPPPPLPHLSGPPPVPRPVRRGRIALTLSLIGMGAFLVSIIMLGIMGGKKSGGASPVGAKINLDVVAEVLYFVSPLFNITGITLGLINRKMGTAKAGFIVGGIALFLWLLLTGAAMLDTRR